MSVGVRLCHSARVNTQKRDHPPPENPDLLTIQQAADLVGVSARTIRRWESQGALRPVFRFGSTVRYARDEVLRIGAGAS